MEGIDYFYPMNFSLFLRNLFFTLLQPGIVAGLVPCFLIKKIKIANLDNSLLQNAVAIALGLAGLILMLDCIRRFATEGKGTLSPADPTKQLVVTGLYRRTRNPMYLGVMGILAGEALFWNNKWLWLYAGIVFLLFHCFIIFREEPRLLRDFGAAYGEYQKNVRRWL
ncbi:MAG: isoprenylcysteine carboxylmethyltransferase family protein [Saprospiraceae bacterium]|nr:isoprenylcysteine carboxylmethyltransferase family protein [Saprospiraceae bacterium]